METTGLYEASGDWLYDVGLPGKSVKGQLVARFLSLGPRNGPVRVRARRLMGLASSRAPCWGKRTRALRPGPLLSGLLVRPCRGVFVGQTAMGSAVSEVDHEPYRHPDKEPQPGPCGQKTHEEEA
jgi:hypothetical protein